MVWFGLVWFGLVWLTPGQVEMNDEKGLVLECGGVVLVRVLEAQLSILKWRSMIK